MNPFNDRDNDVRSITGIAAIYGKDELPLNPILDIVTAPVSALFGRSFMLVIDCL